MELTQIRYFVAVAQSGNMSRAAEQLHVSQPSLSKAVAKLESELGCQLLDRNGKHIALNDEGRRFLKGALAVLRELDDTTFELMEMTQNPVSQLTIGVAGSDSFLTECLVAFAREHPEVRFHLHCDIEAIESIDINQYDMLLYPDEERYRRFTGMPVCRERYLLAVSHQFPMAVESKARELDIGAVATEPFVFIRHGRDFIEYPYEVCIGMGLRPQVYAFTNSSDMHRQIIASGAAVGFVAEGCAEAYRRDPAIRLVRMHDPAFSRLMLVCFKRDKHLSPTGHALKDHVTRYLGRQ